MDPSPPAGWATEPRLYLERVHRLSACLWVDDAQRGAGGVCRLHVSEEQQFHQGSALGEHTEVHPLRGQGRTERTTAPAPNGCRAHHGLSSLPRVADHPLNRWSALWTSGAAVSQAMVGTTSSHSWVILTMSASASVTECTPTCRACCMVASSSCSTCSTLAMKSGASPRSLASATLNRYPRIPNPTACRTIRFHECASKNK